MSNSVTISQKVAFYDKYPRATQSLIVTLSAIIVFGGVGNILFPAASAWGTIGKTLILLVIFVAGLMQWIDLLDSKSKEEGNSNFYHTKNNLTFLMTAVVVLLFILFVPENTHTAFKFKDAVNGEKDCSSLETQQQLCQEIVTMKKQFSGKDSFAVLEKKGLQGKQLVEYTIQRADEAVFYVRSESLDVKKGDQVTVKVEFSEFETNFERGFIPPSYLFTLKRVSP